MIPSCYAISSVICHRPAGCVLGEFRLFLVARMILCGLVLPAHVAGADHVVEGHVLVDFSESDAADGNSFGLDITIDISH